MSMKEVKVDELAANHTDIPRDLLARAVGEDGSVNQDMLGTVLQSYEAGRSGRTAQQEAMIEVLINALREARQRRDTGAVICLRNRLSQLGVHNPKI
jgi:hypothetical protein